jgi:hypothetical protein
MLYRVKMQTNLADEFLAEQWQICCVERYPFHDDYDAWRASALESLWTGDIPTAVWAPLSEGHKKQLATVAKRYCGAETGPEAKKPKRLSRFRKCLRKALRLCLCI